MSCPNSKEHPILPLMPICHNGLYLWQLEKFALNPKKYLDRFYSLLTPTFKAVEEIGFVTLNKEKSGYTPHLTVLRLILNLSRSTCEKALKNIRGNEIVEFPKPTSLNHYFNLDKGIFKAKYYTNHRKRVLYSLQHRSIKAILAIIKCLYISKNLRFIKRQRTIGIRIFHAFLYPCWCIEYFSG